MERERLDDQEAFTHLRRAARSSGRMTEVAREVVAGQAPAPDTDQAVEDQAGAG